MSYKWCAVPKCTNTTIKTPGKLFVCIPRDVKLRHKWLELAQRNPNDIKENTKVFFCEDHFELEKDMTNYYQYKMGFSKNIIMVNGAVPSKFNCQLDQTKRTSDDPTSPSTMKRQRLKLIQECEANLYLQPTVAEVQPTIDIEKVKNVTIDNSEKHAMKATAQTCHKSTSTKLVTADKLVQVQLINKQHYRSKAIQTKTLTKDAIVSPFKIDPYPCHTKPSTMGDVNVKKKIAFKDEERSESDVSLYKDPPLQQDSTSYATTSSKVSDSSTSITNTNEDIEKLQSLQNTLRLIVKKPKMYLGISEECYYIVHLIHKHTFIPHKHILMCLKKIRLNTTFSELEDEFGLSLSYTSKLFLKNVPLIANVLQPFIVKLNDHSIKKTLPIAFRHNYYNVSCIIDCLEIDIQKPSKAVYQALTWSDYKKGNTVKYLISCTPNGLVNYISRGFGGRASDITIVENCDFIDLLEPGTCILADRGFKHLEEKLSLKGLKLLRPPSVASGTKLTKEEVRQTKIIASLRIHVERVIRRIREFHMLKQHSVINKNFLRILNDVIVISCALINLQDSLIK